MGISQDLVIQATAEIISGGNEHPATDQLMQMIEQGFSQQLQEVNAQADMGAISQEDAESMQDPTAGLDPTAVAEAEAMLGGEQAPMV